MYFLEPQFLAYETEITCTWCFWGSNRITTLKCLAHSRYSLNVSSFSLLTLGLQKETPLVFGDTTCSPYPQHLKLLSSFWADSPFSWAWCLTSHLAALLLSSAWLLSLNHLLNWNIKTTGPTLIYKSTSSGGGYFRFHQGTWIIKHPREKYWASWESFPRPLEIQC